MSFSEDRSGSSTVRIIIIAGLIGAMAIVTINEGRKFKKDRDTSVVVKTKGEKMSLFKNQDGATAIEYGLIAALLAVAAIALLSPGPAKQKPDESLPLAVEAPAQEAPTDTNPPG